MRVQNNNFWSVSDLMRKIAKCRLVRGEGEGSNHSWIGYPDRLHFFFLVPPQVNGNGT